MTIDRPDMRRVIWAVCWLVWSLGCGSSQHGQGPAKPDASADAGQSGADAYSPDAATDASGPSDAGDTGHGPHDVGPVDATPDLTDIVDAAGDSLVAVDDTEAQVDTTPDDADGLPGEVSDVEADVAPDVPVSPAPGDPCDDQNACTISDVWTVDGLCAGTVVPCTDADPCTQDHCYVRVGCTHVADPACGDPACRECPTGLGFACDTSVTPAICRNASTREVYVPSGLFRYGEYEKANTLPGWGGPWPALEQSFQSPQSMYLPGFIIDEVEVDAYAYSLAGLPLCVGPDKPQSLLCDETPGKPVPVVDDYSFIDWYCSQHGRRACLESEWEKAAVGGCAQLGVPESDTPACRQATRVFVWGDAAPTCSLAYKLYTCGDEMVYSASHPWDRSVYGVYDMNGTFREATMPVANEDQTCPLTAQVGADGVLPPIVGFNVFLQCPTDPHLGLGITMVFRGEPWQPLARRAPFYDPIGGATHASFRCCRSVKAEYVSPAGAPLWPPNIPTP